MLKFKSRWSLLKCIVVLLFFLRNLRRVNVSRCPILKNTMLLIAHPDDESMFFSPFLFYNKPNIILCLSNGDLNKKGLEREKEMQDLCKERNWPVKILKYKDNESWKESDIILDVLQACKKYNVKSIVTFDEYGISGHMNHIYCHRAVEKIRRHLKVKNLDFYYLKSANLFEKYVLLLSWPTHIIPLFSFFGIENMCHHKSQLTWFRYLYIAFSSYMNFNEIHKEKQKI